MIICVRIFYEMFFLRHLHYLYYLIFVLIIISSHWPVSNKPQPHRFALSLRTSHSLWNTATPQRPSTSHVHAQSLPHNDSHWLTSVLYPVIPKNYNLRTKYNRQLLPHTHTKRSPSSPDMATCMCRCLAKSGIIEQGSNLAFAAFCSGGVFFMWLFLNLKFSFRSFKYL